MEPLHRKNQRQRINDPGAVVIPFDRVTVTPVNNPNNFVTHNLADSSTGTSNSVQWTANPVNCMPWNYSLSDSMDNQLLPCGFQNLSQPGLPLEGVSCRLAPSRVSQQMCLTSPGLLSSGSLSNQVDYSMGASSNCSTNVNYGQKDSGFFQGNLCEIYSMATSSSACMAKNKSSPVGMKQVDLELVTSPEQISSITACSNGDAFSDAEAFDSGATRRDSFLQYTTSSSENYSNLHCLDQGEYGSFLQSNQTANCMEIPSLQGERRKPYSNLWTSQVDMMSIPETSDSLPMIVDTPKLACGKLVLTGQAPGSEHFGYHPCSQYGDQSNTQSNWFIYGGDTYSDQRVVQETLKVHRRIASESSVYLSNHQILSLYIVHKSMPENMKRDISFQQYMHLTVCKSNCCNCEQYSLLASHFDICNTASCTVCGPVQRLCGTNKRCLEYQIQDDNISETFYGGDSNYTITGTLADVPRPFKRLKNENQKIDDKVDLLGGVCGDSNYTITGTLADVLRPYKRLKNDDKVDSLEGVSSLNILNNHDRLPCLEQWPETPVPSADIFEEKLLSSTEESRINCIAKDDFMDTAENMVLNVQPIVSQQEPIELASTMDFVNSKADHSAKLSSGSVEVSSKDPSIGHLEKAIQVCSEANQAELEANCSAISLPAGNDSNMGFEETKTQGGTLADVFTVAQLKEHLMSFSSLNREEVKGEKSSSDSQNTCQLCAKDKLVFGPAPLYCSACGNRIKRNLIYYSSLDEMGARLSICTTCVKGSRGANITFRGINVSKANLLKEKNNEEKEDSWVQCDRCQCWQHRVCGLYNDKRDAEGKAEYICPKCCLDKMQIGGYFGVSGTATFGAKNLPTTKLSDHLEQRLFRRLEQEREEMANYSGKNLKEVEVAKDLIIRVVVCVDKRLKVKQEFLDIFHGEDYPPEFEYRSKVIFLFQKIEGVDVCLFGMCVQEYGSECSGPNNRCIYISYLDSVKYFRPERTTVAGDSLRTFVYHEILVGYLDYCKKRGFTTCYIWACPLVKGEDYIFYCHPETQRNPKQDKLRQWYKSMLGKAEKDGVVVDYTNLYDHLFVPTNTKITAARLPYFEGDYWSGAAEEVVRQIKQESGGGLQKKLPTKRTLKAMGHDTPSTDATKDVLVMQKLGQTIISSKENFLIVRLHATCTHCHEVILSGSRWFCNHCKKVQLCSRCFNTDQHLSVRKMHACNCSNKNNLSEVMVNDVPLHTKDEDVVLETTFFETREAFLGNCQKDNYQFDTLSHAKYSSMMILYNFTHKPNNRGSSCDICKGNVLAKHYWHCTICPTFSVCDACYEMRGGVCHTHKLSRPTIQPLREAKTKHLMANIKAALNVLMHSHKCESKACPNIICGQLKRLFGHCKLCKVRIRGGCKSCKKVWTILTQHSKICRDSDCKIPRCMDLKNHNSGLQLEGPPSQQHHMAC